MAIVAKSLESLSVRLRQLHDRAVQAYHNGNPAFAAESLASLLIEEPGCAEARKTLCEARLAAAGGQLRPWPRALARVRLMLPLRCTGPGLLRKGQVEAALQLADQLLAIDPSSRDALLFLARCGAEGGVPQIALDALELAARLHSRDALCWRALAAHCMAHGMAARAVEALKWLTELCPDDMVIREELRLALAAAAVAARENTQARVETSAVVEASATAATDEAPRADEGDPLDELIAKAERELGEDGSFKVRRNLARLYVQAKRFDHAQNLLLEAANLAGTDEDALKDELFHVGQVRYADAISRWREYGQTRPDRAAEAAREIEAISRDRDSFLLEDYRRRAQNHPDDRRLRFELGEMLFAHGELDEAITHFQDARNHPNLKAKALVYLARCLAGKGMQAEAAAHFEQALEFSHGRQTRERLGVMYELASVYETLGRKDDANRLWKDIYAQDKHFSDVSDRVARLAASGS